MPHPLVVHHKKSKYDIYCGRPSVWGNPFEIGKNGTREEVIEMYRVWLLTNPALMSRIEELRGKILGCWCAPLPCHCDILAGLANRDWLFKE